MTPPDETDLTERAFADSPDKANIFKVLLGVAFLAGFYFLFRHFVAQWLAELFR
jgi:hypothetical protein